MIETERLRLSPITEEDIDIYTKLLTCAKTTRYLPGGKPFSEEYIKSYIPKKVAHWTKGYGTFIVTLKHNPLEKIGYAGVEQISGSELSDIRYALLSDYQGNGYAFEAAKAALDYTISSGLISNIYGAAVNENLASVRLLKNLGMKESDKRLYDSDDLVTYCI